VNYLQFHRYIPLADTALIKAGHREKNDFFDQGVNKTERQIRLRLHISEPNRIPWGTYLFTEEERLFNALCDSVDERLDRNLLRAVPCKLQVARFLISTLKGKIRPKNSIELITDEYLQYVVALTGFHLALKQHEIEGGLCNRSDEVLVPLFLDIKLAELLDLLQQIHDDGGF
jgi:hypothetical protein